MDKTIKISIKILLLFSRGKKHEVFINAHEEGITYFIGLGNLLYRISRFSRWP
jgi:leucyl aminopeptidase